MSRTRKRFPRTMFRCPRGRKRALIEGVRRKAVPPDEWDDVPFDKQCWKPMKVAEGMRANGRSDRYIMRHLRKEGVLTRDMDWIMDIAEYSRPEVPEGCLGVHGEVRNV